MKEKETLSKINKIYLDWFNSDCEAISKHTADMMYRIGEELKYYNLLNEVKENE